jgi:hypothetical protein
MSRPACEAHRHSTPESARVCARKQAEVKRKRRDRLAELATLRPGETPSQTESGDSKPKAGE